MFKNLKLTTKIISAIAIGIIGMLIISSSAYLGLTKIGAEIEEIAEYQIPINTLVGELEKDILKEEVLACNIMIASSDVNSPEFKKLEGDIKTIEKQSDKTLKEVEHLVEKAIAHNSDEKTKATYKMFLNELKELEHEQAKFEKTIAKFEHGVEAGTITDIKHEKKLIDAELRVMDENILKLMHQVTAMVEHSTKQAEEDEHQVLRTIEIIAAIALILSILFSTIIVKSVKQKISTFQSGLLGFFDYLNRRSDDVKPLDASSTDEIGTMSKVVNENIVITKKGIEEDRAFIDETITVLSEFEQGDLCQRINSTVENPALMELKTVLDSMGTQIENNIENVLDILEQYSNYNYVNKADGSKVKNQLLELVNGVNGLGDSITNMLIENKSTGLTLEESSNILIENVKILNTNSNESASALEETAAALEEITATIVSNSESVEEMAKFAQEVTESSKKGEKLANQTTQAMDELNEQVQAISESIVLIDQIAFQTNILSLNAAVEAATAGEAGKGFAVVAQEVRNLASRSADVAKDIKKLVENATTKASDGKLIADNMIHGYDDLNKNIQNTISLINNVADASREQKSGIEQINDAVTELDQQTQENASVANRTQDIADQTDSIAKQIVISANEKEFKGKDGVKAKEVEEETFLTKKVSKISKVDSIENRAPKARISKSNPINQENFSSNEDAEWENF